MKNIVIGVLWVALASTSVAWCQSAEKFAFSEEQEYQIMTLTELTQDSIEDFFAGAPNLVLECTEGTTLPFNLYIRGGVLALDSGCTSSAIRVLQTCYIKVVDDTFFFSRDLYRWSNFQEYFTGMMSINLDVMEGEAAVSLSIELNPR